MAFNGEREQYSVIHLGIPWVSVGGGAEMLSGDQASLLGIFYGFWQQIIAIGRGYLVAAASSSRKAVRASHEFVRRPIA